MSTVVIPNQGNATLVPPTVVPRAPPPDPDSSPPQILEGDFHY